MNLDALDRRILESLQRDASLTNQDLAEVIGLSPSACLKRVKRLRESGVIDRVVALLNPEAIGACLYMVVEVVMKEDNKQRYQRFEKRVMEAPEVKQCYFVTGECDFVLIVSVPDLDAFDRFCNSVLYADDNMQKFRTMLSRKRSKFDTSAVLLGADSTK
jgi:Lrp/AsnC family leucine-responsive transcriptional regulator